MGKNDMKEPIPYDLPVDYPYAQPTPIPKQTHEEKTQINNSCNIMVEDVERLRQILIPTIHTLPNLEPVVQPYMSLSLSRDKASVARGEEHDILIQEGAMQPLTPQTTHITPPDDVAPATSPILDKHSNEFEEEFFDITRVAKMEDGNPAKELSDIIKTYDFETFIRKLLHQGSSERSGMVNSESGKIDFGGEMKVNRALALFLFCVCTVSPFGLTMSKVCVIKHIPPPPATPTSQTTIPHLSPTNNNTNLLLTPKTTPPPLTLPPPTPTQPSKLTSTVAINLDPIELLFSIPPTSPQAFLNSLEDLPPATTNPPPPRPSFDTIERLANEPPPIPPIDSSIPSPTPDMEPPILLFPSQCSPNIPSNFPPLLPLGPNNPFPMLTHEMFCEHSNELRPSSTTSKEK
ncbi:hypothetical protein Tco_1104138 [Tanacetum coccineum]